jgi:hypothetical protein
MSMLNLKPEDMEFLRRLLKRARPVSVEDQARVEFLLMRFDRLLATDKEKREKAYHYSREYKRARAEGRIYFRTRKRAKDSPVPDY